ncbi:TlpA family protein disulfide reductase [Tenacibaculum sp. 190130A14a]|uniref:TlpA family protein disulfide reductase n=1 Tax=Tenacibaculum polynesiense TaxID=3137857 RepID=A0ABP1EUN0_9FLAO
MKNLIPALLATILSFGATTFALNNLNIVPATNNSKTKTAKKKTAKKSKKENTTASKTNTAKPSGEEEAIQKSYADWNNYTKNNVDLMSSFSGLDEKGEEVKKSIFLALLRTGAYIPVKMQQEGKDYYKLTPLNSDADPKIKKSIQGKASMANSYYKMEGKKLPTYDFVDINGKSHNKADTKGKMLVLKCWFITCKICVEEFPELNDLVDKYKDENIEFISLAFDEKDKLAEFLKTKPFKFSTIPMQKDYMAKKLKVKQYPSHLIVDEDGKILKMVNSVKTLSSELERILEK